ncbi:hypothetical protein CCH79_00003381, partial [Gambusia affinis]
LLELECCVRMGNLFGKKKQSRVTEQDKAILQLKQQRDKLRQYQKKINLQLEKERQLAKQLLKDGKKEKALLLLKKKRYQEQLLDKTENQISNLERMVQDLEFAQIERKVIDGLKVGNDCLKKMHEVMSIEEVERILDETQDSIEYQRQINEMLAGSLSQEDEDAVLAELEAITQGDVELPEVPSEPLPEAPEAAEKKAAPDPNGLAAHSTAVLVPAECVRLCFSFRERSSQEEAGARAARRVGTELTPVPNQRPPQTFSCRRFSTVQTASCSRVTRLMTGCVRLPQVGSKRKDWFTCSAL